jgi:hypothetical protein
MSQDMEKFFSVFGKVVLVLAVVAILGGGGYYLGKSGTLNLGSSQQPAAVTTTNPNPEPTNTIESTVTPTSTPSSAVKTKTTTAGVAEGSGLSFSHYTVVTPEGWNINHEFDASVPMDSLTLTRGEYQIKIHQAASGGGQCLYPGDPTPDHPFVSSYTAYEEIVGSDGKLYRRSSSGVSDGKMPYTVCQKSTDTYGAPTSFGHISITAPATPNASILKEIDGIIASLKKS